MKTNTVYLLPSWLIDRLGSALKKYKEDKAVESMERKKILKKESNARSNCKWNPINNAKWNPINIKRSLSSVRTSLIGSFPS